MSLMKDSEISLTDNQEYECSPSNQLEHGDKYFIYHSPGLFYEWDFLVYAKRFFSVSL